MNYKVKEAAKELKCGENVIRHLIADGRIKTMKLPTQVIPDFELDRFRKEALSTQEDLSRYADKDFLKKIRSNEQKQKIYQMR